MSASSEVEKSTSFPGNQTAGNRGLLRGSQRKMCLLLPLLNLIVNGGGHSEIRPRHLPKRDLLAIESVKKHRCPFVLFCLLYFFSSAVLFSHLRN